MLDIRKAAIIGCGFVGSTTAFSLMQTGLFSQLVLIDANPARAHGEAMDLSHGLPFAHPMKIYAGSYDDIHDCALIIITAGAAQRPGETRLELVHRNVAIFRSIIPEIVRAQPGSGASHCVQSGRRAHLCRAEALRLPPQSGIGVCTVLDTARLKYLLSEHLQVDSRSVHAFIIGEHGDSELAVWSGANVSGVALDHFCEMRGHFDHPAATERIYREVRDSAYDIIARKGATYYGVAMAVTRIALSIVRDEHSVLPVSCLVQERYGIPDLCLSLPAVVGRSGVETVLDLSLSPPEQSNLLQAAQTLRGIINTLEL